MKLSTYSDYSCRVIMYLSCRPKITSQVKEIADAYGISRDHVAKIVHNLGKLGYLSNTKGKGGGVLLAKQPREIFLGDFLKATEPRDQFVECMNPMHNKCAISQPCRLKKALAAAVNRFFKDLNSISFADLTRNDGDLLSILASGIE